MAESVSPSLNQALAVSGAIVVEETSPAEHFYVFASYDDGYAELVYDSDYGASPRFSVSTSAISGGLSLTITRRGGWRLPPTVTVAESQTDGDVLETSWRWELRDARL